MRKGRRACAIWRGGADSFSSKPCTFATWRSYVASASLVAGGEFGRLMHLESCFRTPYVRFSEDDFRLSRKLGGGADATP